MSWAHDALASDLATARARQREIVAERVSLDAWSSAGIADVVSIRPAWRSLPTIWEVKVSRGDLLADLRAGKWRRYLPFCGRLVFAVPRGLCVDREIPAEAGLWSRGPRGWTSLRRAPAREMGDDAVAVALRALLLNRHPAPWKPAAAEVRS